MPRKTYITGLQPNQLLRGIFSMQNCQLGMTRNGKPFIKCLLGDKSGKTPARMWNATEEIFNTLPTDGFVKIEGQTQPYQGEMQIILNSILPAKPTEADLEDLLPCTKYDTEQMFSEVCEILDSLNAEPLKHLVKIYLDDTQLMAQFKRAPAAMNLHHAYIGGLLEHTLQLLRLADSIIPHYAKIDRDIVMVGLFLHDLGKCVELTWETGFTYSDQGQLVGHVARGIVWLNEKAAILESRGAPLPRPLLHVLEHIIISHHGQYEFGALKLPATPEAILIHHIDNIDAKMQMSLEATRPDEIPAAADLGGNFTEKMWALDHVRLYKGDPYSDDTQDTQEQAEEPAGDDMPQLNFGSTDRPHKGGL